MQPTPSYYYSRPRTTYVFTTTKSHAGDGVQGMTVESEPVSIAPRNPVWPSDAPVHSSQKKDSIVSSSSKGKGKERERRLGSSATAVVAEEGGSGDGDDENSGDSSESSFHTNLLLDRECQPLTLSTSHISRFSTYGIHTPAPPRRESSSTTVIGEGEEGTSEWLEKHRRQSSTSFVEPAGRRQSSASFVSPERRRASLTYGTTHDHSTFRGLCKRCFNPRASTILTTEPPAERRGATMSAFWVVVTGSIFPLSGAGMLWWSARHEKQPGAGLLALIPFSLWMIFLAIVFTLWRPGPRPKCTCPDLSDGGRRRSSTSPLLRRAREDLDELERWRWEMRRRGSKASKFSSTSIV